MLYSIQYSHRTDQHSYTGLYSLNDYVSNTPTCTVSRCADLTQPLQTKFKRLLHGYFHSPATLAQTQTMNFLRVQSQLLEEFDRFEYELWESRALREGSNLFTDKVPDKFSQEISLYPKL